MNVKNGRSNWSAVFMCCLLLKILLAASFEDSYHLSGQADAIIFQRNIFPFKPLSHGQFLRIQRDIRISIHITEKSAEQSRGEGPGLALVITNIFDFETNFFHNFPLYRLFQSLTDLRKSGNQCITGSPSRCRCIFRKQNFISIGYSYNNSRTAG